MIPEKRARLIYEETNELPLDLSIKKLQCIPSENDKVSKIVDKRCGNDFTISPLPVTLCWNICECLLAIECQLTANIEYGIRFSPPIEYMYNPIEYAFEVHSKYVREYCQTPKKLLFLGMNPGPWGMSQTGVPFGEINTVANWLKLSGYIGKPEREHPARRIQGFACRRSEVSGKRFWSLFHKLCATPKTFFHHSFVHNYCPIALMDAAGRNITPAELKGIEQRALEFFCDEALIAVIKLLEIETIVSVGRFMEKRARNVVTSAGLSTHVLYIPHPSPRSPTNVNWVENTAVKLRELDLLRFFKDEI